MDYYFQTKEKRTRIYLFVLKIKLCPWFFIFLGKFFLAMAAKIGLCSTNCHKIFLKDFIGSVREAAL